MKLHDKHANKDSSRNRSGWGDAMSCCDFRSSYLSFVARAALGGNTKGQLVWAWEGMRGPRVWETAGQQNNFSTLGQVGV